MWVSAGDVTVVGGAGADLVEGGRGIGGILVGLSFVALGLWGCGGEEEEVVGKV